MAGLVVGPVRHQPPRPLLPAHRRRAAATGRRDRAVGEGVGRDGPGAARGARHESLVRLTRVLRSLAGRGPVQRDLDEEITGYLEMLADEKIASGMSPDKARRQARLELGGVEQVKESVRAARPGAWLDTFARDVRYGVRLLAKTPAFSLTAILILALGIGANVAVFGLVNLLLFQPRVGSNAPGELVAIYVHDPRAPARIGGSPTPSTRRSAPRRRVRGHVMAHREIAWSSRMARHRGTRPRSRDDEHVFLGARRPAGGGPDVHRRRGTSRQRRGGGRDRLRDMAGARRRARPCSAGQFSSTRTPSRWSGIAPAGFSGTLVAFGPAALGSDRRRPAVASPMPSPPLRPAALLNVHPACLSSAVSRPASRSRPRTRRCGSSRPRSPTPPRTVSEREVLTASRLARTEEGDAPRTTPGCSLPLGAFSGMAALLLVVASLNIANMQLARGTNRRKEIAMRLALGAGRGRVVCQLLVEGLVLSRPVALAACSSASGR